MATKTKDLVLDPLVNTNPIAVQILGICSALAVTGKLETAIVMSIALTTVTAMSNLAISLIRNYIPGSIRIIVQLTVIASLVIVTDQIMRAYLFSTALVMGRAEAFAMANPPWASFVDGVGNGLGYSMILIGLACVRELFGAGKLLGVSIFPLVNEGGWYQPNGLLVLPPAAFFLIGVSIWIMRTLRPGLREEK
jgi:Na+-transporting NADH:ubiquinone oxidoreductase subunit D